jgi:hypothetical protein
MLELREWIRTARFDGRPWLVLGKGPTFSRRSEFDLAGYNLLSLNHVVRELPVEVAHIIDVDVVEDCADRLLEHCQWLVMPRVPHIQQRPGHARLEEYRDAVPVLRELDARGRLVWYNAATAAPVGDSPVVQVRYFSSEAALSLLGELGANTVRSLGVDGGTNYSATFASLSDKTRLANGQASFDIQFAELDRIADRYGLDYRPLIEPLRIYVGASRRDLVAVRVLEYSIRKHASIPVRVIPMVDLPVPRPRAAHNRPRTGFSFSRFLVPELASYRGRAVYLDSDMLVFGDVAELEQYPFGDQKVLCTYHEAPPPVWADNPSFHPGRHAAVMVLDCSRLGWKIDDIVAQLDEGLVSYERLFADLCLEERDIGVLPTEWNHLEHFEPGVTKLLHYTVVPTQPWRATGNPLEQLWLECYREAVDAGAVPADEARELAREGLIREHLLSAFASRPARSATDASVADVALARAFDRIDELERRQLRRRLRRGARLLSPVVRRVQASGPASRVRSTVEQFGSTLRRPRG